MRAITFIRGVSLVGVVVVGWSMTLRWGDIGAGPPAQWERQVVGAVVLGLICAGCLMFMGAAGTRRSWIARGIAAAAAALGVLLAVLLWRDATSSGFPHLLAGAGWRWMLGGTGLCMAAAISALSVVKSEGAPGKPTGQKAPQKKGQAQKSPAKKSPAKKRKAKKKR